MGTTTIRCSPGNSYFNQTATQLSNTLYLQKERALILRTSIAGFFRVTADQVGSLMVVPSLDHNGPFHIKVVATSVEPLDNDNDGDKIAISPHQKNSKWMSLVSQTLPLSRFPPHFQFSGPEDTYIPLSDLVATLKDTVTTNGTKRLSLLISGCPLGSLFNILWFGVKVTRNTFKKSFSRQKSRAKTRWYDGYC